MTTGDWAFYGLTALVLLGIVPSVIMNFVRASREKKLYGEALTPVSQLQVAARRAKREDEAMYARFEAEEAIRQYRQRKADGD